MSLDAFIDSSAGSSVSFGPVFSSPGPTQGSSVRGFAKHSPSSFALSSSSESSSMNSATSLKSVVPIQEPPNNLCAFALVVQSSMILNVLPDAKYFPRVIRIFFNGVLALGPPATLNGVKKDRLPERWILVHRPSSPSRDQESTCRSSAFCFSALGILHGSKV